MYDSIDSNTLRRNDATRTFRAFWGTRMQDFVAFAQVSVANNFVVVLNFGAKGDNQLIRQSREFEEVARLSSNEASVVFVCIDFDFQRDT